MHNGWLFDGLFHKKGQDRTYGPAQGDPTAHPGQECVELPTLLCCGDEGSPECNEVKTQTTSLYRHVQTGGYTTVDRRNYCEALFPNFPR